MTARAPEFPVDFAAIGQAFAEEMQHQIAEEQEIVRRESEIQTRLARRRWQELFGDSKWSPAASSSASTERFSSKPISVKANPKRSTPRVPRPGLAKKLGEAWGTNQGRQLLVAQPMRKLTQHFGVRSHTSFYGIPLWDDVIKPARERLRIERQAANYLERNARARD